MGNEKQSKTTAKPQQVKPGLETAASEPSELAELALAGVQHDPAASLDDLPPELPLAIFNPRWANRSTKARRNT